MTEKRSEKLRNLGFDLMDNYIYILWDEEGVSQCIIQGGWGLGKAFITPPEVDKEQTFRVADV